MKSLKKPNLKVDDIYCLCSKDFRDKDLVKRLLESEENVIKASENFDKLAIVHETYKMQEDVTCRGVVSDKELINLYIQKLVPKKSVGREYYDYILAMPYNNICPLCGARIVSTIDHYLPKTHYPSLSVIPNNLIPSCRDCNHEKHDIKFKSKEDETLHPYFDNIENHRWVFCDVIEDDPISFKYSIKMIDSKDEMIYKRIRNHFKVLNLDVLYAIKACDIISGIEVMLKKLYKKTGVDAVREQIKEDMESYEVKSLNSWQSAFYRGVYSSEWFFDVWLKQN